jgi:hypothetical protein
VAKATAARKADWEDVMLHPTELRSRVHRFYTKLAGLTRYDLVLHRRRAWRGVRFLLRGGPLPVFSELMIETSAYCNRRCVRCPVSIAPRGKDRMDEATFARILEELASLRYAGRIGLHFFNEPLLDEGIVDKIRRLREAAPRAYIEINTNGDFLSQRLAEQLVDAGMSYMMVTAYNDAAMRRLVKMKKGFRRRERDRIVVWQPADFVGNRAGSLPERAIDETLLSECLEPSYRLVINYKGEAVLCVNDYFGRSIQGNVMEQSMLEIWHGPAFQEVRRAMRELGRDRLVCCRACNQLSTPLQVKSLSNDEVAVFNRKARSTGSRGHRMAGARSAAREKESA